MKDTTMKENQTKVDLKLFVSDKIFEYFDKKMKVADEMKKIPSIDFVDFVESLDSSIRDKFLNLFEFYYLSRHFLNMILLKMLFLKF